MNTSLTWRAWRTQLVSKTALCHCSQHMSTHHQRTHPRSIAKDQHHLSEGDLAAKPTWWSQLLGNEAGVSLETDGKASPRIFSSQNPLKRPTKKLRWNLLLESQAWLGLPTLTQEVQANHQWCFHDWILRRADEIPTHESQWRVGQYQQGCHT